jgi:hypothetical protein
MYLFLQWFLVVPTIVYGFMHNIIEHSSGIRDNVFVEVERHKLTITSNHPNGYYHYLFNELGLLYDATKYDTLSFSASTLSKNSSFELWVQFKGPYGQQFAFIDYIDGVSDDPKQYNMDISFLGKEHLSSLVAVVFKRFGCMNIPYTIENMVLKVTTAKISHSPSNWSISSYETTNLSNPGNETSIECMSTLKNHSIETIVGTEFIGCLMTYPSLWNEVADPIRKIGNHHLFPGFEDDSLPNHSSTYILIIDYSRSINHCTIFNNRCI